MSGDAAGVQMYTLRPKQESRNGRTPCSQHICSARATRLAGGCPAPRSQRQFQSQLLPVLAWTWSLAVGVAECRQRCASVGCFSGLKGRPSNSERAPFATFCSTFASVPATREAQDSICQQESILSQSQQDLCLPRQRTQHRA